MSERRIIIEKRSYSLDPWRLVDSLTGAELTHLVEHETGTWSWERRKSTIWAPAAFPTKQAAIEHLGVIAARTLSEEPAVPASLEGDE